MGNLKRWILFGVVAVLTCASALFNLSSPVSSQNVRKGAKRLPVQRFENFDIRSRAATSPEASSSNATNGKELVLERAKIRTSSAKTRAIQDAMRNGEKQLADRLPQLQIVYNETVGVPEIVSASGGTALATGSTNENEQTLRGFLAENTALYGVPSEQVAELTKVSDYTNPAGNLSFVEFQQEFNGIPVFQGYVRGILAADGRLMRTTGLLAPAVRAERLAKEPSLSATQALTSAAASIKVNVDAENLAVLDLSSDGRTKILSRGPFEDDTKLELVYFPVAPGELTLAYSMVVWLPDNAYYMLVDAKSGTLLWRKSITQDQTQTVTYNIYNNDSPTPSSPTACAIPTPCALPPGISRTNLTVVSENAAADNLGWIPDGAGNAVTTGNNADAGLDISAPNGIDAAGRATGTGRVFSFPYIPDGATDPTGSSTPSDANYRMGIVTHLFFLTNRYHDLVYDFGFTESARNFQNDNFGRGGLAADFVRAEAQDSSGTNNANFNTPPDGSLPRMQMFIFTTTPVQRDGDLDAEVVYHELTHGTSNRLHANASGLSSNESGGMGEGWSDFYGRVLLSDASENVDGLYASGGYVTKNYYYGIRRFPYAVRSNVGANGKPHNPTTFADTDPAQINLSDGAFPPAFVGAANEVHNIGDVWCNVLLEVRANLIHSLGYATGNTRALQIVTDGMKLDPVNPTMINARDAILGANCAGSAGANELDIWQGFKVHGMGFRAGYRLGTDGPHVLESFDGPNLTLGTITPTETIGNGNGQFDPGETVSLSIQLSNGLCATDALNVSAALSTGGNANYGTIVHGANASLSIIVAIPIGAACGSSLPINITVDSTNLGPIIYTYNLRIGQAAALTSFENFDGVTAPNLPNGWTTSHTGASPGWATSTGNPDTAPNSATSIDPSTPGTGSLTSPAIPVDTALGKVSFRNLYNLEDGFDTMVLAIQIDNGAFDEIISAGGSFVSGGYNSNIGWTGLSGGTTAAPTYITSVVNLPPAASGHVIHLRWIVSGDANTIAPGQAGVSIDTIQLATTAQACVPFGVTTFAVGGRITDGSANGVSGIQVTVSGSTNATATTDNNGNYNFPVLVSGGNYTVTPTTPGYDYTPLNRVYNNLSGNVTNADFTAIPAASISGRVTGPNGVSGVDGITITLSGTQSGSTTTAGGGFYSFPGLTRFGNYTVTPSGGNNNTFTPPSRTYNNLNAAVTDANFVANENLSCTPIGSPVTGSIAAGDTTQTNRLLRDGNPSTCAGKTFPGESAAATIRYDTHTFVNTSGAAACIRISVAGDFSVHSEAYLGSYDPANKGTNYLGDLGVAYAGNNSPASYTVNVPAGATYVIVVNETAVGVGGNYTVSVCESAAGAPPAPPAALPGQVLITEFRQSVGSTTSSNEYVELYNNTDAPISVGGFGLVLFNATFGGDVVLGFPANVNIPRRGHLLIANVAAGGYSLTAYASADLSHANANLMPDNQGFGLINASRSTLIDSVGFVGNSGNFPYIEGQGLRTTSGARPNVEHAWIRRIDPSTSRPTDTDINANDFQLVSVTSAAFNTTTTPIQSILGAPGPENAASPVDRSSVVRTGLVDPTFSSVGGENRKRFLTCGVPDAPPCPQDPNTSAAGYLSIRRKFTNNGGASINRLRFRIIDMTTLNSPGYTLGGGQADLRALTSGQITVMVNGTPTVIQGTTLDSPPTQALGGGLNSSLSAGTITLANPLPSGQFVNVQFMLGVQQGGSYRILVNIEAVP